MRSRYSGLDVCGNLHGYFRADREAIEKINLAAPDILFVCLGFPKQEKWISENLCALHTVKLAIGLGGSFDVWAGNVKRAPRLIGKLGFEWLWRLFYDPKKLSRVPILFNFSFLILKEALFNRDFFNKCYEIDNFLK